MSYDAEAPRFDATRGLPPTIARGVAEAVLGLGGLREGAGVLEVGSGTGEIGVHLAALQVRYRAFDLSGPMNDLFRARAAEAGLTVDLRQADGNGPWPAEDRSMAVVFGSRVLHLLDPGHVLREVERVAAPSGVTVLMGSLQRPKECPQSRLRRAMRRLVAEEIGEVAREAGERRRDLAALGCSRGAVAIESHPCGRWVVRRSVAESLRKWDQKAGLAGAPLAPEAHARVMARLRAWAEEEFGDLALPLEWEESYVIEGMRFHSI